ncbi:lipid-A-disaccharide synthase isoform 1 [Galdieria sulphuraria]|uniref:lipid-A-disaccharide synthase n=1 Tax=Galdieria sulphuraria TaxID=130081 RepID=M2XCI0_GALSU|nr:lipid-A-disaccharide synthase isoform 1 [Galdieria sulphuraria]EME27647.1 lipid-A-disaccharide synthase isoform 1 [Galdieria sulphuraria]|eukprot:XP_005704167.1 lipid-A-disaccharide synthase isoform 1 [Galdieria sulphuraria]
MVRRRLFSVNDHFYQGKPRYFIAECSNYSCFCVHVEGVQNTSCRSYLLFFVSKQRRLFKFIQPRTQLVATQCGVVKRIFFSTGELSGDLQGSILIRALTREALSRNVVVKLYGLGGSLMKQEGLELLQDTSKISSIGLIEAVPHLWASWSMIQNAIERVIEDPPDIAILIDYVGPNLQLASKLRKIFPGLPIVYYIAPQEWVWGYANQKVPFLLRYVESIGEICDKVYSIFPAEHAYYQRHQIASEYVGHPLFSSDWKKGNETNQKRARESLQLALDAVVIALVPASREQEIRYILPIMAQAAKHIQDQLVDEDVVFIVPCSRDDFRAKIQQQLTRSGVSQFRIYDKTSSSIVIAAANLCIMKSGTVNLEAVAMQVPQLVLYRLSNWSAWLGRNVLGLQIPFIASPNCVEMRLVVPELVQENATAENVSKAALNLLRTKHEQQRMLTDYERIAKVLHCPEGTSRAAKSMFELMQTD